MDMRLPSHCETCNKIRQHRLSGPTGKDGVIVEVFEWKTGAIASAHQNPDVQALWGRYAAVCDYVPLHELPEAKDMFAQFEPIDL